jgi:ubiquinone/menaquinone biosynthesis C-methylase UbiE
MHKFSPQHAERLENAERYKLLQPEKTLARLGLTPGMTFVDVGAGTGFFARAAAGIVGAKGVVYALDMSDEMVGILKQNGVRENMRVLKSEEYKLPLPDAVGDVALLSTVLHENPDINKLLAEVARVMKASGRIVIIEWKKQDEDMGPEKAERLGVEELLPQLGSYEILEQGDVTPSHYYLVIRRKGL